MGGYFVSGEGQGAPWGLMRLRGDPGGWRRWNFCHLVTKKLASAPAAHPRGFPGVAFLALVFPGVRTSLGGVVGHNFVLKPPRAMGRSFFFSPVLRVLMTHKKTA